MAIPWDLSVECLDEPEGNTRITQPTYLKHLSALDVNEEPPSEVQCGIMCNVGEYNQDIVQIQKMIAAGMTIARLDFRDQERDFWNLLVQNIRKAVHNYSAESNFLYPLALIMSARGTDIITGDLMGGPRATLELEAGKKIKLTSAPNWKSCGTNEYLFVSWDNLTEVNIGDDIFIDTVEPGRVKLRVDTIGSDSLDCTIEMGGIIGNKMTVRVSQVPQEVAESEDKIVKSNQSVESVPCAEPEIRSPESTVSQLRWAVASDIDGILIPRAETVADIDCIVEMLGNKGKHLLLIANIETMLGVENIDSIMEKSDCIMLDRGILSTDMPIEKVFIATKAIAAKCTLIGKPFVVCATISEQLPVVSVSDVAALVLDGADVIAVDINWAAGDGIKNAERCIAAAAEICRQAENIIWQPNVYGNIELMQAHLEDPTQATCVSAVELAARTKSSVIVSLTNSGRSAKLIAHVKPHCPVVVLTRLGHVARQLRFWRGLRTLHFIVAPQRIWACELQSRIDACIQYCRLRGFVRAGDPYVTLTPGGRDTGFCNTITLNFVGPSDKLAND